MENPEKIKRYINHINLPLSPRAKTKLYAMKVKYGMPMYQILSILLEKITEEELDRILKGETQ